MCGPEWQESNFLAKPLCDERPLKDIFPNIFTSSFLRSKVKVMDCSEFGGGIQWKLSPSKPK